MEFVGSDLGCENFLARISGYLRVVQLGHAGGPIGWVAAPLSASPPGRRTRRERPVACR